MWLEFSYQNNFIQRFMGDKWINDNPSFSYKYFTCLFPRLYFKRVS